MYQCNSLQHHYVVSEIKLISHCDCNGHGDGYSCPLKTSSGKRQCACADNTCGDQCERCCPGHNQYPWRAGTKALWEPDNTTACEGLFVILDLYQFFNFLHTVVYPAVKCKDKDYLIQTTPNFSDLQTAMNYQILIRDRRTVYILHLYSRSFQIFTLNHRETCLKQAAIGSNIFCAFGRSLLYRGHVYETLTRKCKVEAKFQGDVRFRASQLQTRLAECVPILVTSI